MAERAAWQKTVRNCRETGSAGRRGGVSIFRAKSCRLTPLNRNQDKLHRVKTSSTSLSPAELHELLEADASCQLFDVRPYPEFARGHIRGARMLPLVEIPDRLGEIDRTRPVALVCRTGKRSAQARETLAAAGFDQACDLTGGVLAWQQAGLPLDVSARAPWSLERQVRVVAGSLVLLGIALGVTVHPAFLGLSAFVGAGLVFAGLTDWCGMGLLLAKMPWNRAPRSGVGNNARVLLHALTT
jgi:rhodanese-related sulfurtransferase